MKSQLILAQAGTDRLALFVNAKLVLSYSMDEIEDAEQRIIASAHQLAAALHAPLSVATIPAFTAESQTWQERFEEVLAAVAGDASKSLDEQHNMVVYAWQEGGIHPDTEDGPGDAFDEMCFDLSPPMPGTPYVVLVPLGESRAALADAETAEVEKRAPAAKAADAANIVNVRHWNCYGSQESTEAPYVDTHQFEIDDHRTTSGQARLILASRDTDLADDLLDVLVEVNTSPLDGRGHVPCAHVHIDYDEQLVSLFKIGDKLLVRPNTGVRFVSDLVEINGQRESVLWIE